MKKLLIYILPLLLAQGCTKKLEEEPRTFISPDAFFNSPDSYVQAVKGIYSTMPAAFSNNSMMMREMFSDIIGAPSAGHEQAVPTYQNNHQPFFYNVREQWASYYTIIKNANFVVQKLGESNIISETQKNELLGEARFLRAYAYFNLVQFFGDIPLTDKPIENYSNLQIDRSPQENVYSLIEQDLLFAESNLPLSASEQGRVYKWVATAILAKVYLTKAGYPFNNTEHYQDAKQKALDVINSGAFALKDNYADIFHTTSYTSETIWEQQFDADNGGNGLHSISIALPGYVPILNPAEWFINSFSVGDQRKVWGIQENYMGPDNNVISPFFYKFVSKDYIDNGTTASASTRLNYSIPIIRLAEMYLIAAEAENEINGPAAAYTYINEIRRRARVDKANPLHVPDLSGLSKQQFRDAVLMERKWELHLEGSTWFDLKRTHSLDLIQTIRGNDLVHHIGDYNYTWYIPDNEITNNNITQNPTYQ